MNQNSNRRSFPGAGRALFCVFVAMLAAALLFGGAACSNKKSKNPLAQIDSKQPDKVLYDRSMAALKQRKYDVARLTLQTLINTYPDSEYVARAKLSIGDAWYQEGGSTAWAQAESEYRDFITFFPNMPEAAEAQLKIANIHYQEMEKADRDFTHAKRAEEEYRNLLLQYPDSKLAETARTRLLQVQEVLAEREFRIGRFYFLRGSYAAGQARLRTLTDTYPLYSRADEALYMQGQSYELQINTIRNSTLPEALKARLIREDTDGAAMAYSKVITRYPAGNRADDARKRLQALDRPVPKPTPEAVEQNKKEIASRGQTGRIGRLKSVMRKGPDFNTATTYGQPTLVDPKPTDADQIVRNFGNEIKAEQGAHGGGDNQIKVQPGTGGAQPAPNQPVPHSDTGTNPQDTPQQAPAQVNEAGQGTNPTATSNSSNPQGSSTSKKKKKKFLVF